ncbi:hypothetical protein TorRG33x02_020420 [Trema orientale]|uniref:Uncharacterized protein n=1 Tax=Trema orientale TaxID=63057 RepID=A0A2P5FWU3_TREOI|nr:hypothetical protein TorRG33x02_020420 [Trema orientale]
MEPFYGGTFTADRDGKMGGLSSGLERKDTGKIRSARPKILNIESSPARRPNGLLSEPGPKKWTYLGVFWPNMTFL